MADDDLETSMYIATFAHVRRLGEVHAHLTASELKPGFKFKGERIYHVPRQQHYATTIISESKGEGWFILRPRLKLLVGEKRNDRRPMSDLELEIMCRSQQCL